jgi:hypothetical protein
LTFILFVLRKLLEDLGRADIKPAYISQNDLDAHKEKGRSRDHVGGSYGVQVAESGWV